MNREMVKPHLYPWNRNPRNRNHHSRNPNQESEPSPPAKDAFALLRVDVRDRLRPGRDFLGVGDWIRSERACAQWLEKKRFSSSTR
jgi:hypothetical protein